MADSFADQVLSVRQAHAPVLPDRSRVPQFVEDLVELLFPQIAGGHVYASRDDIQHKLDLLAADLAEILAPQAARIPGGPQDAARRFFGGLPSIYATLWLDARAIHEGDPASESLDEVIAAYPGFFAVYT